VNDVTSAALSLSGRDGETTRATRTVQIRLRARKKVVVGRFGWAVPSQELEACNEWHEGRRGPRDWVHL
jgi:hypothetical protein